MERLLAIPWSRVKDGEHTLKDTHRIDVLSYELVQGERLGAHTE